MPIFGDIWKYANYLSQEKKILFLLFSYSIYFCYVIASKYSKKIKTSTRIIFGQNMCPHNIASLPFLLIAFIYIFRLKDNLFAGYTVDYSVADRGPLLTATLSYFSVAIIKTINVGSFKNWPMILYWGMALLVLTMGTRLYFMSSIITVFSIYCICHKKIQRKHFFIFIFCSAFLFSIIGLIRQRNVITFNGIIFIFLGEPFLTSFSLFSSLHFNELPLFNLPYGFISGFINLIPTAILPDKIKIIDAFSRVEFRFIAPQGAKNIFVSLMENFGMIGSIIFILLFAFLIGRISQRIICSYYIILGILCFSFFRDPFTVSIKYILQLSLLVPIYYYLVEHFIKLSVKTLKHG
jgi:hypothetical protein